MNRILPMLWVFSIGAVLMIAARRSRMSVSIRPVLTYKTLGMFLVILLPLVVRVVSLQPDRIHGDDLLTATFSQEFRPRTANFFAGVPQGEIWVAKFPAPYFLFQKLFLRVAGASVLTVKLSVLPYIFITSLMTYLITSRVMGRFAGIIAVVLYAFMPISLYLETLGLHFISSTAVFMIFFYLLLRTMKSNSPIWFASTGVACAACYLFYTSSYIAFPLLLLVLVAHAVKQHAIKPLAWALIGFTVTIAPFAIYAGTVENYFVGRMNQVSLLNGSWSAQKELSKTHPGAFRALGENIQLSLRSMVIDGIGGHGGYTFNRQAMFHPAGLIVFLVGSGVSLLLVWRKRALFLILLVIILSYCTGVALTIPPPAYHRFSLAFPFIAIVSSVPFMYVAQWFRWRTAILVVAAILAVYTGTGIRYFQRSVASEATIADASVIRYVNATFPGRAVHIAAFPTFALGVLYPFFLPTTATSIDTQYHNAYLSNFNTRERYVYIITLASEFKEKFIAADPAATYIPFSEKYSLLVNE